MAFVDEIILDDIVEKADVNSLSTVVASVLNYNIEKMSVSKKIFRISQLIIDFLLHYKKHSTFKLNSKVCLMFLSLKNKKRLRKFTIDCIIIHIGRFNCIL